jgi:hypothetical protein
MSRKRKPQKGAAPETVERGSGYQYLENQAWMLTPPWITLITLAILGAVLHMLLSVNPVRLAWGVFGLTVGTGVLTASTAVIAAARGSVPRVHAIASVSLGGLWLVVASITGLGILGLDLAALLIGAVLAGSWNIRRLLRGSGQDQGHGQAQQWADLADDVKTMQGRIRQQRVEGATRKVSLDLAPGMTAQDAQGDAAKIAAALHVPAIGVRITPDPDDAGRVELSITPEDMLRRTIPWPGPSAGGQSVARPVILGRYEDGADLTLTPPGTRGKQTLSHLLLVGMTGAGKSELLQVLVADMATRTDTEIDYLDVAGKADQTIGPIRAAIRTLITDRQEAEAYLKGLLRSVPARAQALARVGMREWAEGAPIPFRAVVIDEGAALIAESADFVELARVLRSVGVWLILAIQRVTYDQMPTSARANFGTVACFGVHSAKDAGYALSGETMDAGAVPHVWRNRKPGYLYLEAPGVNPDRYAMPARAFLADAADVERIIGEAAAIRHGGAAIAQVRIPSPEETRAAATRALAEAGEEGEIIDDDMLDPETAAAAYRAPIRMSETLGRIDPDADLPDIPGADMSQHLGQPERIPPLTPEQARNALDEFLAEWRAGDDGQFRRSDLISGGVLQVTGRRKSWLSGQLQSLVDAGELEQVGDREDGVYAWPRVYAA